jgi:DNA-binding CsgD family transcriptional regulator/predicted ATPase
MGQDGIVGSDGGSTAFRRRHPLIGRDAELRAIVGLLRSADAALITITGRDGSGRTRLGMAALTAVAPDLPGGATLLSLAEVDDIGTLFAKLAGSLQVEPDSGSSAEGALRQRLLQLPTAILCDDADGRTDMVTALAELIEAGGGRLLASANRPLGLSGEHVIRLGSLAVPDAADRDPVSIARSPAVQLYVTTARAADHRFDPDDHELRTIAELCRALDGLPGAIELAAARVTLLPPAAYLVRLGVAPLEAGLRRPGKEGQDRPTAFGSAIAAIHATLSPDAAVVLRRTAALHGPVPLDGLEEVAADPDWTTDRLLDAIGDLVDCHLLEASGEAEPRFRLPGSVHAFAREQLAAAGERAECEERRDAWCLRSMAGRSVRLDAPPPAAAMDDLLASQQALLTRGDVDASLRLAVDCGPTWSHQSWPPHARRAMDEALALALEPGRAPIDPDVLLAARIWHAKLMADAPDAAPAQEQAAIFRGLVEDARSARDPRLLLLAHASLALALPTTLDFTGAGASVQEGLALAPAVGDPYWMTRFLYWSGMMASRFQQYRTATVLGGQGMAAAMASGDDLALIPAGILLHHMAAMGEVIPPATPTMDQLLATARRIGSPMAESWVLSLIAHEAVEAGDLETARTRAIELLHNGQHRGSRAALVIGIAALVGVAALRGDLAVCARMSGMIARDMAMFVTVAPVERVASFQARLEHARASAGPDVWDLHAAAGATLPIVSAVHEALAWAGSSDVTTGSADNRLPSPADGEAAQEPLTPREEQVLRRIARGDSNKDIAVGLGMSPKTVMHHSMSIYRKLGVRGRSEATAWAYRNGHMAGPLGD